MKYRLVLALTWLLVMACNSSGSGKKATHFRDTTKSYVPNGYVLATIKGTKIYLEIAATPAKRELGLMYRDSLPENHGMLFVFDREQPLAFWMKNTKIPLSIAFLNKDFVIVDIQDMEPFSEKTHISAVPAMYALEVNQGFFRKHGIEVGDTLKFVLPK